MTINSKKQVFKSIFKNCLTAVFLGFLSTSAFSEESGEAIFKSSCSSCHSGGLLGFITGAPKIGKESAWEEYFTGGFDEAVTIVLDGSDKHTSMKEKENLNEKQVRAALNYVVEKTPVLKGK